MALPDFLIVGAPKAGSTALHAALALHPQLYGTTPKEPKFFLTGGERPDPATQRGPGDAHSAQEWVWREADYRRLFDRAPAGSLTFESTPFYLWDRAAHRRIAATLPDVKVIAVVRDPLDRAFSNWTHLWADGLEPERDFRTACEAEPQRVAAGYAPFWRYLELGRYGEQLRHLHAHVDPARVRVVRYRRLVDSPQRTLDDLCAFLGVRTGVLTTVPRANAGRWAPDGLVNAQLRRAVRLGAAAGAYAPPQVWRQASRPLLAALQRGSAPRATLAAEDRIALRGQFAEDVALLSDLLGEDHTDWLSDTGRGTFTARST